MASNSVTAICEVESDSSPSTSDSDLEPEEQKKVTSLLDKLRPAKLSELARARKQKVNKPPVGVRKSRGTCASNPKNVSPSQRLREFSDESFSISAGRLFCNACREEVG